MVMGEVLLWLLAEVRKVLEILWKFMVRMANGNYLKLQNSIKEDEIMQLLLSTEQFLRLEVLNPVLEKY